jgi:hypothetical protein
MALIDEDFEPYANYLRKVWSGMRKNFADRGDPESLAYSGEKSRCRGVVETMKDVRGCATDREIPWQHVHAAEAILER